MKALKYCIVLVSLTAFLAACDSKRSNATLGGTQDTAAVAGNGNGKNMAGTDSNKTDSLNKGNVDPSGRGAIDTAKTKPPQ